MNDTITNVDDGDKPLMTLSGLVGFVNETEGMPLKPSRAEKDVMTGQLRPDCYMGRVRLFKPSTAKAYAQSLLSPTKRRLVGSRSGRLDEMSSSG